ncbi:unnamed protein product [Prorocentrum cordatum]|uniref:Uncharacterized protein n=1 Tax=Prorocentrum cordatum TaxID=2364126 RepID=A0ABN9S0G1_9DINO|nr:unnamed protein product [Polarella glacialis]
MPAGGASPDLASSERRTASSPADCSGARAGAGATRPGRAGAPRSASTAEAPQTTSPARRAGSLGAASRQPAPDASARLPAELAPACAHSAALAPTGAYWAAMRRLSGCGVLRLFSEDAKAN